MLGMVGADKEWYQGTARGIAPEHTPTYTVVYPDGSEEYTELSQFVVFADPTPLLSIESKSTPVLPVAEIDETKAPAAEERGRNSCYRYFSSTGCNLRRLVTRVVRQQIACSLRSRTKKSRAAGNPS